MIIKMTVHDNDFQELMEKFGKYLGMNILQAPHRMELDKKMEKYKKKECTKIEEKEIEKCLQEFFNKSEHIRNTYHKDELLDFDKTFFVNLTKEHFKDFVNYLSDDYVQYENDKLYVLTEFECEIVDTYSDKWENGEFIYLVTSNQTVLIN